MVLFFGADLRDLAFVGMFEGVDPPERLAGVHLPPVVEMLAGVVFPERLPALLLFVVLTPTQILL
jgi:hypothetical protein